MEEKSWSSTSFIVRFNLSTNNHLPTPPRSGGTSPATGDMELQGRGRTATVLGDLKLHFASIEVEETPPLSGIWDVGNLGDVTLMLTSGISQLRM